MTDHITITSLLVLWKESLNSDGQQFYHYQPSKESLNSDGQQFHHYQPSKESLNSDGQQFHHYQPSNESLNSDGQQFHHYQQNEQSPLILTDQIKQWWSTIPPLSTKRTMTSHLNWSN